MWKKLSGFFGGSLPELELQMRDLPGDVGKIAWPKGWEIDLEDGSTLMSFPEDQCVIIRVSSFSFQAANGAQDGGLKHIKNKALKKGHEFRVENEKAILWYFSESEHEGEALELTFYEVGMLNSLVLISASYLKKDKKRKEVLQALEALPRIADSVVVSVLHATAQSDTGDEVKYTSTTVDPSPEQESLRELTHAEQVGVQESIEQAAAMSWKYGADGALDPVALDLVFASWAEDMEDKASPEGVASVLGIAFGQHLVERLGLEWRWFTDAYGEALAVYHPAAGLKAFPVESVIKRIESGDTDLFVGIKSVIQQHLDEWIMDQSN